jgi:hypothetical protein
MRMLYGMGVRDLMAFVLIVSSFDDVDSVGLLQHVAASMKQVSNPGADASRNASPAAR